MRSRWVWCLPGRQWQMKSRLLNVIAHRLFSTLWRKIKSHLETLIVLKINYYEMANYYLRIEEVVEQVGIIYIK